MKKKSRDRRPARLGPKVTRGPIIGFSQSTACGLCPRFRVLTHACRERGRCFRWSDKGVATAWQQDKIPAWGSAGFR